MDIDSSSDAVVSDAEALAAPTIRGGLNPGAARLFRVYRTMANMLDQRGYMVPRNLRDMTPADFKRQFGEYPARDALTVLVEKADDEKNQLFVFYPEDEKLGVKPIKVSVLFGYLVDWLVYFFSLLGYLSLLIMFVLPCHAFLMPFRMPT